jgi:hypothetical protein
VLIREIDGTPAAALSLGEARVIADTSRPTDRLVATLRMRADAIRAFEATPSLRHRLLAALPKERGRSNMVPLPAARIEDAEREPVAEWEPVRAHG